MPERYKPYRSDEFIANALADKERQRLEYDSTRYVAEFNARLKRRLPTLFSPTIRAVLLSKHHWLQIHCPGCSVVSDIDLRVVQRDPEMPLTDILPSLSCQRCRGKGPTPRIVKLSKLPQAD